VGVVILVIIVFVAWLVSRLSPMIGQPHIHQLRRFHASLAADRSRTVVCLGDSLTQGNASFDYPHALAGRLEPDGYTVLNAGVNGDRAWNVLQRIDEVIRAEPAYVVLLIGTNDARAIESPWAAGQYIRQKKLPQTPDEAFFMDSYRSLLDILVASECIRTLVVTIPPIGERRGEPIDEVVARMNRFIAHEAAERDLQCIDLNHAVERLLDGQDRDASPAYDAKRSRQMILAAVLKRHLLGWSWERIARRNGLHALTDMVHLNATGALLLVDLVEHAVREKLAADC